MFRRPLPGLCAVLAAACGGAAPEGPARDEEPPLVRAVAAELRPVQREIRTTGFLESEHRDTVRARVAGRLLRLHADLGTEVEAGALLAEIDDRETQSAMAQLEAQRESLVVDRSLAELEVEAAGRRTAAAGIEERRARAEYDRQSQIDPEFVSPKALQDADLAWQGAQEAVKVAEFAERKSRLEVTRIDTAIAELDARIAELKVRLEHFRVTAPFAGVVTERMVSAGSTVAAGSDLFGIVDPVHLVAWLDRPQAELDLVRRSVDVTFTTDALPGRTFTADVDQIGPVVDRDTGHFRVRVRVRAADARTLVPGMFVRARIRAEEMREALMVPKAAVLSEGDVAVVMAARGGKAVRVDLDPGLEVGDLVECKNRGESGLVPGDLVIVEGHEDLEDQSRIRVAQ